MKRWVWPYLWGALGIVNAASMWFGQGNPVGLLFLGLHVGILLVVAMLNVASARGRVRLGIKP